MSGHISRMMPMHIKYFYVLMRSYLKGSLIGNLNNIFGVQNYKYKETAINDDILYCKITAVNDFDSLLYKQLVSVYTNRIAMGIISISVNPF